MSTFLNTLKMILAGESHIPELPTGELIGLDYGESARPIGQVTIQPDILLKIARLQTLAVREHERGEMPDVEEVYQLKRDTGKSVPEVMSRSLAIQEDSTRRQMMLEQLIVEVVREAFPSECERLDVEYVLHPDRGILFMPMRRRRFLD